MSIYRLVHQYSLQQIQNNPKLETAEMANHGQVDQCIIVHPDSGILSPKNDEPLLIRTTAWLTLEALY